MPGEQLGLSILLKNRAGTQTTNLLITRATTLQPEPQLLQGVFCFKSRHSKLLRWVSSGVVCGQKSTHLCEECYILVFKNTCCPSHFSTDALKYHNHLIFVTSSDIPLLVFSIPTFSRKLSLALLLLGCTNNWGQLIIKYYLHIYSGAKLSWLLLQ